MRDCTYIQQIYNVPVYREVRSTSTFIVHIESRGASATFEHPVHNNTMKYNTTVPVVNGRLSSCVGHTVISNRLYDYVYIIL